MSEPLLSLSTIVSRETIELTSKRHPAGKRYELANLADLGPYEYATLVDRDSEARRLIASKKKLTKAQEARLEQLFDDVLRLLIPSLEPSVLRELTTQQKQMIVLAWAAKVTGGAAEGNRASRRTGGASSRGSKRSTAATQKRGGTRPAGS